MSEPLITLTTDFGEGSPYVAVLKGVILAINPQARVLDLSHRIRPQNLRHAAYFLNTVLPYFREALHVIVVDPGVGTERALLYVEVGRQRLLAPDNGCWTGLIGAGETPTVLRLAEPRYWRPDVSATFHGRDILAPVAAHLSRGLNPQLLGPPISTWVNGETSLPLLGPDRLAGEVVYLDDFGNLLTNIPAKALDAWRDRPLRVTVASTPVARRVRTYGEAEPGTLVFLVSSGGMLEIAVAQGSAAQRLEVGEGARVEVQPA